MFTLTPEYDLFWELRKMLAAAQAQDISICR